MNGGQGPTRRTVIGAAVAFGGLALASVSRGADDKQAPPNATRTAIHQDVEFKASMGRIYDILLDGQQFAAVTGQPAEIDPKVGGAFRMFGGLIEGRNLELVPGRRIVQAWRPTHWDQGVYSRVTFRMQSHGVVTTVVLDQTGFPEGEYDSLSSGWEEHYWHPLANYLG